MSRPAAAPPTRCGPADRTGRRAPFVRRGFGATMGALAAVLFAQACTDRTIVSIEIGAITVTPGTARLEEGETLQFRAIVEDVTGRPLPRADVLWSTDPPAVLLVDSAGMSEALTPGTVEVYAGFRGVTGRATVTVVRSAGIAMSRSALRFYGAAGAQSPSELVVLITNAGGGELEGLSATVEFEEAGPAGWVTPTLAATTAPTTLTVTPQTATLPVGVYSATVSVSSPDDDRSPVTLPITLSITDLTVTESDDSTRITEGGGTDDFGVALAAAPDTDVEVDVVADSGVVTVSPERLVFTPADWDSPQTVTVTAVDEVIADGDRSVDVLLAVVDSISDAAYVPIPDKPVPVWKVDNDEASITLAATDGGTTVAEPLGVDSISVVLDVQPLEDVTFDVTANDPTEAVPDPTSLTFTPGDWDTPQTVTITAADDGLVDGEQISAIVVSVDTAASAAAFDGLEPDSVLITTTDDDVPGFSTVESDGSTQVNEAGTTDTVTVVLDATPVSPVVLTVSVADPGEVAADSATLTFGPSDWDQPKEVVFTGVDDELLDGAQATDVTIAIDPALSDDLFDMVGPATLSVTTVDNDTPGFTITETGGTTVVDESGATDQFLVVLDAEPSAGTVVVLTVTTRDAAEVTTDLGSLTFNPTNWFTGQSVTVTGQNELIDDGDRPTAIVLSVTDAVSDPDYVDVADDSVLVTNLDDDTAGMIIVESDGGTLVSEAQTTDTATVELTSEPVSDVVISLLSQDETEVTVAPTTLTFTPSTWNIPQEFVATGVDDLADDGDRFALVVVSVVGALSDDAYDFVMDGTVNVTNTDNDAPSGLSLTAINTTTVNETGTLTDDFTVVLDAEPASDVVVTVTSQDLTEVAVDRTSLTFTPGNWDVPQVVTVTGVDEDIIDGDQTADVVVAVDDALSDDNFDGIVEQLTWTNLDDDVAGLDVVAVGGTSVNEGAGFDDFTVALTAEPASDVVIDVTTDDPTETSVAPDVLTFSPGNWDVPQTVTVTGEDDDLDDGDQTSTVTVTVRNAASDADFGGLFETLLATTADDDGVGFTITEQSSTAVTEGASIDSFTVVLDAQPTSDVVLLVSSADTDEVTVAPASLTFTMGDWDSPQRVTVTGVDDDFDDGDQETTLTVAVDDLASDPGFAGLSAAVVATTADDDDAGFTLSGEAGTTVPESGSPSDPFTVVLAARPLTDVVIDITSSDIVEATVAPASLTFTTGDWDVAQAVTVTGGDDLIDDGDQITQVAIAVNAGASDDGFDAVPAQSIQVTTVDDDAAGLSLAGTGGIILSEGGASGVFTIVLDAQPVVNILVDVASSDATESSVTPTSITFTPGNWNTPHNVTVRGVDDASIDGAQPSTISVTVNDDASDDAFDGLSESFGVSTADDDVADFTIREVGGTRVTEGGGQDEFFVRLDAQPSANVVFNVVSADEDEVTVSPSQLIFTLGDWDVEQAVTVTGEDDDLDDDDTMTLISVSADIDLTLDNAFDGLGGTVTATNSDDDGVGLTVTEIGSTTVPESGLFDDNFTVVLDAEPMSDVVIDITSADTDEATVSPAALTFTSVNWNTPQTVTVTGVDDDVIDGDVDTNVTIDVRDGASDPDYAPLFQTVVATTIDDDLAGFVLTRTGGLTVDEAGFVTDDFDVALTAQPGPGLTVRLTVTSLDGTEVLPLGAFVTFTTGNWNVPQPITVEGVDDDVVDGSVVSDIELEVDEGLSDPAFTGLLTQTVSVTTTDNDLAGLELGQSDGTTEVEEAAGRDTVTVRLEAQPSVNVVVNVSSGDTEEATVFPSAVTFTPSNWHIPQPITITGANEVIDDGNQLTTIDFDVDDANSDNAFDGLSAAVVVTTLDDDDAGFQLSDTTALTVSEGGTSTQFSVVLTTQPVSNVVLSASTGDPGEVSVTTPTRTFTAANWATPQQFTVRGVNDDIDDGDQATTIAVAVVDASSDDAFDLVSNQFATVTTTDNDVAGFTLADTLALGVDETATTDQFTVVLNTQPTSNVVLSISSDDAEEVTASPAQITFTPGSWDFPQTVTVTGEDDALIDGEQTSVVTVAVVNGSSDDNFDGLSQSVSVRTVDDDSAALIVTEQGGTRVAESGSTDQFDVRLSAEPVSDVVVDVLSEDTDEATVDQASLTFTPSDWDDPQTVVVTGVDDFVDDDDQVTRVTITVDDGASDNAFDTLADTVLVTTTDDDGVGFTITEFGGTEVWESGIGLQDQFGVQLDAQPTSNVVLDVVSSDLGEATIDQSSLLFTTSNWDEPQQIVVTGVDDDFADGPKLTPVIVTVDAGASDDTFDGLPPDTVFVTTNDDDTPGFSVDPTGGTTSATEAGAGDAIEVVLTARPETPVRLTIASADGAEAAVGSATVVFDSLTWSVAQLIAITAVDDEYVDGSRTTDITVQVDEPASDPAFAGLGSQTVSATTNDDDVAELLLTHGSGGSTQPVEGGAVDTLLVRLGDGRPLTDVVIQISSDDPTEATVSHSLLTFTTSNWNVPRIIEITAENDLFVDGTVGVDVTAAVVDGSSDDAWDDVDPEAQLVATQDNDVATFSISHVGPGTTVNESGSADSVSIVLGSGRPLTPVTINVTSDDTNEASVSPPTSVTFDSVNWTTPKRVTVTGVNDGVLVDGPRTTDIIASVDPGSDGAWTGLGDQSVSATTTDDDVAGYSVTHTNGSTIVSEDETMDSIRVVLTAQPLTDVVFDIDSDDTGEATVSLPSLTFTNDNWDDEQWVVVTGVNHANPLVDGPQQVTVTVSVNDGASDGAWDPLADQDLTVTNNDNDVPGIILNHTPFPGGTSTTVREDFDPESVRIILNAQPQDTVYVVLSSDDPGEMNPQVTLRIFTPSNWNTPQFVNVLGEEDGEDDGDQEVPLRASIRGDSDPLWIGAPDTTLPVIVIDIDP